MRLQQAKSSGKEAQEGEATETLSESQERERSEALSGAQDREASKNLSGAGDPFGSGKRVPGDPGEWDLGDSGE